MTSDDWNRWLTLAANVGVIGGLVLVAFEINQTQTQLRIDALADGSDNYAQSMEALAQDEALSKLLYRAETEFEELTTFERWRVSRYLDGFMVMSEQDFLVLKDIEDGLASFRYDWERNMTQPHFRAYWLENENRFGREFRAFVNELLGRTRAAR